MDLRRLRHRGTSFRNAGNGLRWAFSTQPNLTIHTLAASAVTAFGILFRVSWVEWVALLLAMSSVFVSELLNTALEFTTDGLKAHKRTAEDDRYIMLAKDISAAAVLVSAIFAALIGLVVFLPRILSF